MKDLYLTVRNTVLFYFIIVLVGSAIVLPGSIAEKLFIGLVFGVVTTAIPHLLKFFKLPVNSGSIFLLCIIISFIYFVVMSYFFTLIQFSSRLPDIFVFIGLNTSADRLMSIVYLTLISSLVIVGFDSLEKNA